MRHYVVKKYFSKLAIQNRCYYHYLNNKHSNYDSVNVTPKDIFGLGVRK